MLLAFALIASLSFAKDNFFIRKDYQARKTIYHHDDRKLTDKYQNDIYKYAHNLFKRMKGKTILDVGCGSGYKLVKYFSNAKTTGVEVNPAYTYLKAKYPQRTWVKGDFSKQPPSGHFDLVISADVIEHIENPDDLLNWISEIDFKYLVLSTPNRDALMRRKGGKTSETGPPGNIAHYREWSAKEFRRYIEQYFTIVAHKQNMEHWGQMIVATKK